MKTLEQAIEKLDYKGYLDLDIPQGASQRHQS